MCKDEQVELPLVQDAGVAADLEGLPATAKLNGSVVRGTFSKKTVFGFGAPNDARHYWQVDTTDNCPKIASQSLSLCTDQDLQTSLQVSGGEGAAQFELLTDSDEFSLTPEGLLTGTALDVGVRELSIAVTDARGVRTLNAIEVTVSNQCPDLEAALPASCAGSGYEFDLAFVGKTPIELRDLTPVQKDSQPLSAEQAKQWQDHLHLEFDKGPAGYVLSAQPDTAAVGDYVLSFTLINDLAVEQRNRQFSVTKCSKVPADFTACQDESFDFDLQGPSDAQWSYYDPADPLRNDVFLVEGRLRGTLPAGEYEIKAQLTTPANPAKRLVTLKLLVLSATNNSQCSDSAGDAGTDAETMDADVPDTSSDDGSSPRDQLPRLDGCVGEPLKLSPAAIVPNASSWWVDGDVPDWLSIQTTTGRISGTPTQAAEGSFTIHAKSSEQQGAQQYLYSVSASCVYAYKSLDNDQIATLFVGHVLQNPPAPVEVLPLMLRGEAEVGLFRLTNAPGLLALATSADNGETRVYVTEAQGRNADGVVQVNPELLPVFPLSVDVLEMEWSQDGQLGLILGGVDGESASRRLMTFQRDGSGQWVAGVDTQIADSHSLAWMGSYPCVVGTGAVGHAGTWGMIFCASTGGNIYEAQSAAVPPDLGQLAQLRATDKTVVAALADPADFDGSSTIPKTYVLSQRIATATWSSYLHHDVFASPRGDLVAKPREEGLEVTHSGDATDFDYGQADYTPIALIQDCQWVSVWSVTTGALVCTRGRDDNHLRFATFEGDTLTVTDALSIDNYDTTNQKTFVDDKYFVFDMGRGRLGVVTLGKTPKLASIVLGQDRATLAAIVPLAPSSGHSRVAVQVSGQLLLVDLSTNAATPVSSSGAELPHVIDCTRYFDLNTFANWCGGVDVSRGFETSAEGFRFLYIDVTGALHLADTGSDAVLAQGQCGTQVNCRDSFAFAK